MPSRGSSVRTNPNDVLIHQRPRAIDHIVRVLIAGTVAVVLLAAAHTSLQVTGRLVSSTPAQQEEAVALGLVIPYQRQSCLVASLHRLVPRGASLYVGSGKHGDSLVLAEIATLWAHPVTVAAQARWGVTLVPNPKVCEGEQLKVVRLR